jgi:hypothetical protein
MNIKYKLFDEPGTNLKRLVAYKSFRTSKMIIRAGDWGGLVECEDNLW